VTWRGFYVHYIYGNKQDIVSLAGIFWSPAIIMSFPDNQQREEMIERFKIPQNASMFADSQK